MIKKIERKLKRKTNKDLVETILAGKKSPAWLKIIEKVASPKRSQVKLNLDEIDGKVKDGEIVVIPGKVLGAGELDKKVKVVAFSFSKTAEDKLSKNKIVFSTIKEEMKDNPDGKKIKLLM